MFEDLFTLSALSAFVQVIFIDIALAADNAVIIALAASGLEPGQRRKAIFWGIVAATVMRIGFAAVTVQLLQIIGLLLAGGILLLWVCWKMWQELHPEGFRQALNAWRKKDRAEGEFATIEEVTAESHAPVEGKTLRQAIMQIVIADVSMSLDNVLAVAGAARDHPIAMVFGLALSIALMGFAAMTIARLVEKHKWIAYLGLAIVLFAAFKMIYEGGEQVLHAAAIM